MLLERIADELLSGRADDGRLDAAAAGLYSLCSSVTGIDDSSPRADDSEGTRLPGGEAISPRDAARCVLDHRRTSRFLRGLHAAILEARKRFPGALVEILYAGCGPFAPLAVPLTTRFSPAEVRFTLLDVHERSLDAARLLFQALGKSDFVRDYVRCDAASHRHDAPHPLHVVVVETMQAALEREPQVAVTMNLAPQLCPGGILVPERITVDCCLFDPAGEGDRFDLGRVLDLAAGGGTVLFPKRFLHVPEELAGERHLMLLTGITVFDRIALDEGESGLTSPRILFDAGRMRGGEAVEIEYHPGDRPGFRYRSLQGGQAGASPARSRPSSGYPSERAT